MQTIATALATHFGLDATTVTVCWAITKSTGSVVRGTAHDRDIVIGSGDFAGTYLARSAAFATDVRTPSDGAVRNMEMDGAFRVDAGVDELTVEDIEGGVYDQAPAVLFMLNWASPDDGQKVLAAGTLGEFYRDSNGRYRSENRGFTQALSQQIMQTYSERCNVRQFGDARCGFDVAAVTRTGTVATVTDRRRFTVSLDAGPAPLTETYYDGARLVFTSGDNDTFAREVKTVSIVTSVATIVLWDEAPADIEIGDTISLPPACDRRYETCRDVHDNLRRFRGHGIFAAGKDRLMRGPAGAQSQTDVAESGGSAFWVPPAP